ncbi:alanine dehydrogenase [Ginsengibacter hankyongi]|uniref:Alanine dehydrogenase n=1 Tax=Ginsengibacter hankyongi TaxID=2607284 RepID=A0A5J5IJA6_9BACT|nr:NAD(P)-dependent oxidoreductase [Ginsengibacter hankyongi]KAA9038445.1 alanine dehydrogenase [Ginsengibacter hankyongi]
MLTIGLIREGKIPPDNRVALTPAQCKWIQQNLSVTIKVQQCEIRCFKDREYIEAGIEVKEDIGDCDVLLGIKEVPVGMLIPGKTYLFFSHTKKMQPYNQKLLQNIISKKITLIDYECLEHDDGTRIIGFGFFAGVVGAHNGMMAYGNRTGAFKLGRVYKQKSFQQLIHTYFGLQLPLLKIAVTGSGRVAHGILEVMNLMEIHEAEPDEYLEKKFDYPVYVHLKGADLYEDKLTCKYSRIGFHEHPENYNCLFKKYISETDILLNGVYWEEKIPRLFEMVDIKKPDFTITTIADISDDRNGSVPCNIGDATMEDPIYGVDKLTGKKTIPYLENSIDIMAVGNLPNELPRDASRYFGEQLIKFILNDLIKGGSKIITNATIVKEGNLTNEFGYLKEYAGL